MAKTAYLPSAFCVRCGKVAVVKRVQRAARRYVEAKCHGETKEIEFADAPNQEVRLWGPKP